MRAAGPIFVCAALALAGSGCINRPIDEKVFDQDYTTIRLRSHKRGMTLVDKGYQHPLTISAVRTAHILSRIDLRKTDDGEMKRVPAIPTESLYLIGEGLAEAFAKANSNQEVVVMSIRRSKRLGIFDRKYLTAFVAYRKDDLLYIHMGVSDWEIPPHRRDRLPEPVVGKPSGKYRIVPSRSMTVVDSGSVAVAWRDPIFAKPTRTRITPGGRVVRRTILMESEEEAPPPAPPPAALPLNLAPETLRKLADLEDARRRGDVSETQYELERRRILESDPGAP